MKIITKPEMERVLTPKALIDAVRLAFIAFSEGKVTTPPVGYLQFANPPGDMHIKYGHAVDDDIFVVKLATGFYDNPKQGLPSSNGLIIVLSAKTGEPLALLQDEGFLTDSRTAAAGAIASYTLANANAQRIGVIGTGVQARMQLVYHHHACSLKQSFVWGRDQSATEKLASDMQEHGIDVMPVSTVKALCETVDILVTTTPTTEPIVAAEWVKPGTHITAVGADAPGKQELYSALFKKAAFTVFDSREQCLHHGEACHASNTFGSENSAELGDLLNNPHVFQRKPDDITIVDLTGIAAQDIAAAKTVWEYFKD